MKVSHLSLAVGVAALADDIAELADYTEVNERVQLGKGANRAAARRLKGEIGELIADRYVHNGSRFKPIC